MPGRIEQTNGDSGSSDDERGTAGNGTDHARRIYTQADQRNRHRRRREVLSDQSIEIESSTNLTHQRSDRRTRRQEVDSQRNYHQEMEGLIQTEDAGWHESDEPAHPPFVSHDPNAQSAELISRIARVQEHSEASVAWESRLQEQTSHFQSNGIIPSNMDDNQRREYYSILDQVTREIYQEYNL